MDLSTLIIYLIMYLYGYTLIFWTLFFDKHSTKRSRKGAIFGLGALSLTVFYVIYVLWTIGLQ